MHWSSGNFQGTVTVGKRIYITDHKHLAISGGYNYTTFGIGDTDSNLVGNNVEIVANNKLSSYSFEGTRSWSKKYVRIESGSNENMPYDESLGIQIISKNGPIAIVVDENPVNIIGGTYINLIGNTGITIGPSSYGTSLPSSGVEGQVFFKLIS